MEDSFLKAFSAFSFLKIKSTEAVRKTVVRKLPLTTVLHLIREAVRKQNKTGWWWEGEAVIFLQTEQHVLLYRLVKNLGQTDRHKQQLALCLHCSLNSWQTSCFLDNFWLRFLAANLTSLSAAGSLLYVFWPKSVLISVMTKHSAGNF